MVDWKQKLTSRKFWMVVVGAVFLVLNQGLNLGLDEETITAFIYLILGYVFAEGAADIVSRFKQD